MSLACIFGLPPPPASCLLSLTAVQLGTQVTNTAALISVSATKARKKTSASQRERAKSAREKELQQQVNGFHEKPINNPVNHKVT